ncbi:MAG: inositol monophosphatase family protein [Rhodospirillales bacterium]
MAGRLAWDAASLILSIRARGFATSQKTDRSPVTEGRSRRRGPDHRRPARRPRRSSPSSPRKKYRPGHIPRPGRATWFVDPLDGTRDFAAGRDSFCVNIGLVRDGLPVLGIVCVPATAGDVRRHRRRRRLEAGTPAAAARSAPACRRKPASSCSHPATTTTTRACAITSAA